MLILLQLLLLLQVLVLLLISVLHVKGGGLGELQTISRNVVNMFPVHMGYSQEASL